MKRFLFAACLALACGPEAVDSSSDDLTTSSAASLTAVSSFGSNPGGLNMYRYVPANMPANAAIVVAMHGCTQTANDFTKTGWNEIAEKYKFYVVYPEQTTSNNAMRCFNWGGEYGDPTNIKRGQGENESIKQMVDKMKTDFSVDASRVFVTGFSGGGAQASLMLAVWPDVFAAGATVAGIPYNCTTTFSEVSGCLKPGKNLSEQEWGDRVRAANPGFTGPWPRLAIWQGANDSVVDFSNTTQLLRQFANVHGIDTVADETTSIDTKVTAKAYRNAAGETLVQTFTVAGMDHGTPVAPSSGCGTAAQYVLNVGVCSSLHIATFFGLTGVAPEPTDAGPVDAGKPDAGPVDAGKPDAGPVDAGPVDAGQVDAGTPGTCKEVTDTTYNLVLTGKAVRCGAWSSYACAGGVQLGYWNVFVRATVHSDNGTTWLAGKCQ